MIYSLTIYGYSRDQGVRPQFSRLDMYAAFRAPVCSIVLYVSPPTTPAALAHHLMLTYAPCAPVCSILLRPRRPLAPTRLARLHASQPSPPPKRTFQSDALHREHKLPGVLYAVCTRAGATSQRPETAVTAGWNAERDYTRAKSSHACSRTAPRGWDCSCVRAPTSSSSLSRLIFERGSSAGLQAPCTPLLLAM